VNKILLKTIRGKAKNFWKDDERRIREGNCRTRENSSGDHDHTELIFTRRVKKKERDETSERDRRKIPRLGSGLARKNKQASGGRGRSKRNESGDIKTTQEKQRIG